MRGRRAAAVEAATAAGDQGDLMTRRDEFTNHAQSWRRAAVGAGAALVVTLGPRPACRPTKARRRGRRWVRRAPGGDARGLASRISFVRPEVRVRRTRWGQGRRARDGDLGCPRRGAGARAGAVVGRAVEAGSGHRVAVDGGDSGRGSPCGRERHRPAGWPGYQARFGFVPAADLGISADPSWGEFFQARPLAGGLVRDGDAESQACAGPRGVFTYPEPFARLG